MGFPLQTFKHSNDPSKVRTFIYALVFFVLMIIECIQYMCEVAFRDIITCILDHGRPRAKNGRSKSILLRQIVQALFICSLSPGMLQLENQQKVSSLPYTGLRNLCLRLRA